MTETAGEPATKSYVAGFFHAGVTVRDLEESLRFYRDALRLEVETLRRTDGKNAAPIVGFEADRIASAMLRIPGTDARVELVEYQGIERHSASCRPCDFGSGHFSLFVDDADALYQRLLDHGFTIRGSDVVTVSWGPHAGAKVMYAIDPDGYHVELLEQA
jgi:lactoylglutathione lyase